MTRCEWAKSDLMIEYHDREWGVPVHDDRTLFEFLILEGAQAGLSWETILKKREAYREAFDNFNAEVMAAYGKRKISQLLANVGIVRNKLKIESAVKNAQVLLDIQEEFGTFDRFIWQFTNGRTIVNRWKELKEIPARSEESDVMSRQLKRSGFKFVGSTICYAHMQATGMVNDHVVSCFRYKDLAKSRIL